MGLRSILVLGFVGAGLLLAGPSAAIVNGQLDGNLHPEVGALVAEDVQPGVKDAICTGTLIAPQVFLTAAHCTSYLASLGIANVWVTFDPQFTSSSKLIAGTYVTDPAYNDYSGAGGNADPNDLAVVLLSKKAGVAPARLPTAGLLDSLNLPAQTFTAVGYGESRTSSKNGGQNAGFFDSTRRYATQSFQSLEAAWLNLSENSSTGNGGSCSGDSGGPHFLGGTASNLEVALTVEGDTYCRSTDKDYRLDTPAARSFLGNYVTLP